MNIDYFIKQGYKPEGVIHIGAHEGGEIPKYKELGLNILCFEPLEEAYTVFKLKYPDVWIEKIALGSENRMGYLNVSGDGAFGQASSMLTFTAENFNMTGNMLKQQLTAVARFEDWVDELLFENAFDTVIIDTQGYELEVLKGFGDMLPLFKYYLIECSKQPLYEGGAPGKEVVQFMEEQGFIQDSELLRHEDVAFIRSDIRR